MLIGNPRGRNKTINQLKRDHGNIAEGYKEVVVVEGEKLLLDCMRFEDGFLVGITDLAIFYGRLDSYEWTDGGYVLAKQ
ncbi:hypothetical protein [Jeotgalibaca porci]|uniref:hypothetical protein n=1 Tax=Jeotgalibaca porci TaxID=1868793 RepID=UPI0035A1B007